MVKYLWLIVNDALTREQHVKKVNRGIGIFQRTKGFSPRTSLETLNMS